MSISKIEAAKMNGRASKSRLSEEQPSITSNRSSGPTMRAEASMTTVDMENFGISDFDEDERMPTKMTIAILFLQTFLMCLSFSIIIPTSRQYAESLGASEGFSGLTVGVVGFASALTIPLYRFLVKKSYAGCLYFLVAMMQIGGVMYSLAQLAKTRWMMLAARIVTGAGGGVYPILQYIAEYVGKSHRSSVQSLCGIARSLGFAMGPITAAILVYVDFNIGELQVNKETNAGWTVAIFCIFQALLVLWYFPKHGSQLLQGNATVRRLPADESSAAPIPLKEHVLYYCVIGNIALHFLSAMIYISSWEVSATKVIQTIFKWSIQNSALFVGGLIATTIPTLFGLGKLSYRCDDRMILIICTVLSLCSVVLMFEYGESMWIIPYLMGSFFFINSAYCSCSFSLSLSSKVASVKDVESVQTCMTLIGLISRGIGAIIADLLTPNYLATVYLCLSLACLLSTLLLYKRLVPSRLGV